MKSVTIKSSVFACGLIAGFYWISSFLMNANHETLTQTDIQSNSNNKLTILPSSVTPSPAAKPVLAKTNQGSGEHENPVNSAELIYPEYQEATPVDAADIAKEAKLREIEMQRLGLGDADRVIQAAQQHPNPQVRKAAVDKLAKLEAEYEATSGMERRSGDPGQFVSAVAGHLPYESDLSVMDENLNYLVEYGENSPALKDALDGLLQRSDLPPDMLSRVYELLTERYGMTPDDARAKTVASPSVQAFDSNDWRNLDDGFSQLGQTTIAVR